MRGRVDPDVTGHDPRRVRLTADAAHVGDELAQRGVVREHRLRVERERTLAIGIGEELARAGPSHLRQHLAGVLRVEAARVSRRRELLLVAAHHVPRRMSAARVHHDEEAIVLVAVEPVLDVVEDRRGRCVVDRRARRERLPPTREPVRCAGGRVRREHRR